MWFLQTRVLIRKLASNYGFQTLAFCMKLMPTHVNNNLGRKKKGVGEKARQAMKGGTVRRRGKRAGADTFI